MLLNLERGRQHVTDPGHDRSDGDDQDGQRRERPQGEHRAKHHVATPDDDPADPRRHLTLSPPPIVRVIYRTP